MWDHIKSIYKSCDITTLEALLCFAAGGLGLVFMAPHLVTAAGTLCAALLQLVAAALTLGLMIGSVWMLCRHAKTLGDRFRRTKKAPKAKPKIIDVDVIDIPYTMHDREAAKVQG